MSIAAFFGFYFSLPKFDRDFDYTLRIAEALLHGHLGPNEKPPSWLNEFVPSGDRFYSVFPLGSVLVMLPVGVLKIANVINGFPSRCVTALIAALLVYFFFKLSKFRDISLPRRLLLSFFPVFATWTWCNLGWGGAWQVALGVAVLGETAALFFTLVRPHPLLAGASFALAFGNRTELLLTAPFFAFFLLRERMPNVRSITEVMRGLSRAIRAERKTLAQFFLLPAALGLLTAAYNHARFGSVVDFGYSHIPGVINEPWYRNGIFSVKAVAFNAQQMLFEGMRSIPDFPYFMPSGFGASIFLSSPFLFLLFREGAPRIWLKISCWLAILLLTSLLWCHGNPGGWQFSYRYAMILLPWMFLLILENGPLRLSATECILFAVSVVINGLATYLFLWTQRVQP